MKKIIICILVISSLFILNKKDSSNNFSEKRSIFISYLEISKYLGNKNSIDIKNNIDMMIDNCSKLKFNEIILQVRSFSDAIYYSDIFPYSRLITGVEGKDPGIDILDYFINRCHENNISVIAWINPFRVRSDNNISNISYKNPAYKYLESDYIYINNGVYYNPSKKEVIDLIVDGVKEIVENYKIDGILFDDYFYPSNEIDVLDYNNYVTNNKYISKDEYNLNIINDMVKRVHEVCFYNNILFGISPDGNISNNYSKNYADVYLWGNSYNYVDFIMPQIYYGFNNESKPFVDTVNEWRELVKNRNIKFYVALAFYKNGREDSYARSGSMEWINNKDIIMREVLVLRNIRDYSGFSLFRYDYIFNNELYTNNTIEELINLKKILN